MKILLFGKAGQVGWELQRSLAPLGEVVAPHKAARDLCGDLTDLTGIARTIRHIRPDIIVNAAAYTAVELAESDPELARTINTAAPHVLASEAKQMGSWLIHYSTDYVFGGNGQTPWLETDATAPMNVYGATKRDGENAIRDAGCLHLILRSSWIYSTRGKNFAKTVLKMAQQRDPLSIVDDQIGAPTSAELVADVTAHAVRTIINRPEMSGVYHLAAGGETSWFGFANFLIDAACEVGLVGALEPMYIRPVWSDAFPSRARRPKNSRLDTSKLCSAFALEMPRWEHGAARMIAEIKQAHYEST